jgi:L-fuculose-phosphate aldolase
MARLPQQPMVSSQPKISSDPLALLLAHPVAGWRLCCDRLHAEKGLDLVERLRQSLDLGVRELFTLILSQDIVEAGRGLIEAELSDGTSGNVSVRRPDGVMVITPSSLDFRLVTERDLVEVELASGAAKGQRRPSSEWRLHALVYEKRSDVQAVVHHHGPWSTAAAVARTVIPVVVDEAADIGPISTAPYAPSASEELAQVASDRLRGGCNAVLLANHGVVVVGRTLKEAMRRAKEVERSSKIYIGAELLGGAHPLDAAGQVFAVAALAHRLRDLRHRRAVDIAHLERDLLDARHHKALSFLDGLDEGRRLELHLVRARV